VLRLLLARGAAVDAVEPTGGWTAFHFACYHNHPVCAEALARAGCDVGLKDGDGKTGRELAEGEGHTAVVERLRVVVGEQLRAVAGPVPALEPVAVVGDGGPADQLVDAVRKGDAAAVPRLLAAGADPNASVPGRTASGVAYQTALISAAAIGRLEAARLLLNAGADPSLADGNGATPLMCAARTGQLEVLRLLLGWGAAVDAVEPTEGWTAFHAACVRNHADCAEALARAGCDVGLKISSGQTGRELAEAQGSKDVARRLRALARQAFVGVLVELAGLVGAVEHNGKRATVMSTRPSRGHHASVPSCLSAIMHQCHHALRAQRSTSPLVVPGAALPAGEAALHAGAAGAATRGQRRGEAHGRAAGELCAGAFASQHAVRPGQARRLSCLPPRQSGFIHTNA
jgi:ankyrin repeat protein